LRPTGSRRRAGTAEVGSPAERAHESGSVGQHVGVHRDWQLRLASALVVAACVGFVFWQLDPRLLFADTLEAGGDTGAHVLIPAYLEHLLRSGQVTGWSPDWFAGFPFLTFYFPLPALLVVGANLLLPYDIAFKLVSLAGTILLPLVAFVFGRLGRLPRPIPEALSVASVLFLFNRSFTIDGGNIASTLAGEWDFSLSLLFALLFLGVCISGMESGRGRAWGAVLLAAAALSHIVPTFWASFAAIVLVVLGPGGWRQFGARLRWAVPTGLVGLGLVLWWVLPFGVYLPYTTSMGWIKITAYLGSLYPSGLHWVCALAAVGAVVSIARGRVVGRLLTVVTAAAGAAFVLAPSGILYNGRLLPFWILGVYFLAAIGVGELVLLVAAGWAVLQQPGPVFRPPAEGTQIGVGVVAPLALAAIGLLVALVPLGLPSWVPLADAPTSFVPAWIRWNLSGYQGKAAWPEYRALMETMSEVGRRDGCGRAMWEYGAELNDFGTTMSLMLLPYWTGGCIDSMEGLLFESSATTPYHFLNQAELSSHPSEAMVGLPYGPLDVRLGVEHLQLLGVRYYMAFTPGAIAQANADPALVEVAKSGPWATQVGSTVKARTWVVYRVRHSAEVTSLTHEPVVMTGVPGGSAGWLKASLPWYLDPGRWDVLEAATGPADWARVSWRDRHPPARPVRPAGVSAIQVHDESLSFDVRRVGSPVLVKMSYFPNWHVVGGRGPYRVAPNEMVVVPTAHHVELVYGATTVDRVGEGLSLLAVVGLVWLAREDRRRRRRDPELTGRPEAVPSAAPEVV